MPGGIQVFARALGMTTKELLKASEEGKLIASEVLPLVADELAKTARNNDALNKSLTTSRSQWTMFVSQFKLLFDGFGSSRLDRGIAGFIQSLSKLLKIIKPVAQILFYVLGVLFDLIGVIGKGLLSSFDGFLNVIKALATPMKRLAELLHLTDGNIMKFLQDIANVGVYFVPFLKWFAIIGDALEEFVNIFTGHAQGFLAGTGDTIGERLRNGLLGQGLSKLGDYIKELLPNLTQFFTDVGRDAGLAFADGFKSGLANLILPEWMMKGKMFPNATPIPQDKLLSNQPGLIQIFLDGTKKFEQVFEEKTQQQFQGNM